jgi:hypothetical protein
LGRSSGEAGILLDPSGWTILYRHMEFSENNFKNTSNSNNAIIKIGFCKKIHGCSKYMIEILGRVIRNTQLRAPV